MQEPEPMTSVGDDSTDSTEDAMTPEDFKAKGNDHYRARRYAEAMDAYSSAIELDPSVASYYANRAAAEMNLELFEKALADCKRSLALDDSNVKVLLRTGTCLIKQGAWTQAQTYFTKALDKESSNSTAKQSLQQIGQAQGIEARVRKLLQESKWGEALAAVERVIDIAPTSDALQLLKARGLLGLKRWPAAAKIATGVMRHDGNNAQALYVRGTALYHEGNLERARDHFKRALGLDPDSKENREMWKKVRLVLRLKTEGTNAYRARNYQEAYDLYTQALAVDDSLNPVNAILYNNRASAATMLGKRVEAIADCSRALALDPSYEKALLRRAKLYSETKEFQLSVHDYNRALEMNPNNRDAKRGLRQAELDLKKANRKDYYKILNITAHASPAQVKKAYHKAALRCHPDKNSHTEEARAAAETEFKEVQEAYAILSDADKRHRYDTGADLEEEMGFGGGGFHGHGHGHGGMPPDVFNMFFGGGGGGARFGF